jgi:hypothetical protein
VIAKSAKVGEDGEDGKDGGPAGGVVDIAGFPATGRADESATKTAKVVVKERETCCREERFKSFPSSPSLIKSNSHRPFAALLIRLTSGGDINGGNDADVEEGGL